MIIAGFGVCCVIINYSCGDANLRVNNSYFANPDFPGVWRGNVTRCSTRVKIDAGDDDICQLRLDFLRFRLRGPGDNNYDCEIDRMTVLGGGSNVPAICGVNDGAHS